MDLGKILSAITSNGNIDKESILALVNRIKNADLKDESVLRQVIREVSAIANKPVSKELEDQLVNRIINHGIPDDLSELL